MTFILKEIQKPSKILDCISQNDNFIVTYGGTVDTYDKDFKLLDSNTKIFADYILPISKNECAYIRSLPSVSDGGDEYSCIVKKEIVIESAKIRSLIKFSENTKIKGVIISECGMAIISEDGNLSIDNTFDSFTFEIISCVSNPRKNSIYLFIKSVSRKQILSLTIKNNNLKFNVICKKIITKSRITKREFLFNHNEDRTFLLQDGEILDIENNMNLLVSLKKDFEISFSLNNLKVKEIDFVLNEPDSFSTLIFCVTGESFIFDKDYKMIPFYKFKSKIINGCIIYHQVPKPLSLLINKSEDEDNNETNSNNPIMVNATRVLCYSHNFTILFDIVDMKCIIINMILYQKPITSVYLTSDLNIGVTREDSANIIKPEIKTNIIINNESDDIKSSILNENEDENGTFNTSNIFNTSTTFYNLNTSNFSNNENNENDDLPPTQIGTSQIIKNDLLNEEKSDLIQNGSNFIKNDNIYFIHKSDNLKIISYNEFSIINKNIVINERIIGAFEKDIKSFTEKETRKNDIKSFTEKETRKNDIKSFTGNFTEKETRKNDIKGFTEKETRKNDIKGFTEKETRNMNFVLFWSSNYIYKYFPESNNILHYNYFGEIFSSDKNLITESNNIYIFTKKTFYGFGENFSYEIKRKFVKNSTNLDIHFYDDKNDFSIIGMNFFKNTLCIYIENCNNEVEKEWDLSLNDDVSASDQDQDLSKYIVPIYLVINDDGKTLKIVDNPFDCNNSSNFENYKYGLFKHYSNHVNNFPLDLDNYLVFKTLNGNFKNGNIKNKIIKFEKNFEKIKKINKSEERFIFKDFKIYSLFKNVLFKPLEFIVSLKVNVINYCCIFQEGLLILNCMEGIFLVDLIAKKWVKSDKNFTFVFSQEKFYDPLTNSEKDLELKKSDIYLCNDEVNLCEFGEIEFKIETVDLKLNPEKIIKKIFPLLYSKDLLKYAFLGSIFKTNSSLSKNQTQKHLYFIYLKSENKTILVLNDVFTLQLDGIFHLIHIINENLIIVSLNNIIKKMETFVIIKIKSHNKMEKIMSYTYESLIWAIEHDLQYLAIAYTNSVLIIDLEKKFKIVKIIKHKFDMILYMVLKNRKLLIYSTSLECLIIEDILHRDLPLSIDIGKAIERNYFKNPNALLNPNERFVKYDDYIKLANNQKYFDDFLVNNNYFQDDTKDVEISYLKTISISDMPNYNKTLSIYRGKKISWIGNILSIQDTDIILPEPINILFFRNTTNFDFDSNYIHTDLEDIIIFGENGGIYLLYEYEFNELENDILDKNMKVLNSIKNFGDKKVDINLSCLKIINLETNGKVKVSKLLKETNSFRQIFNNNL